jgi:competence protein ComEA
MLSDWIKDLRGKFRLTGRQSDGLMSAVLLTIVTSLLSSGIFLAPRPDADFVGGNRHDGAVVVKLAGDLKQGGIYYLKQPATVSGLLEMAGVVRRDRFSRQQLELILETGQAVAIAAGGHLTISQIHAAERLALDLPIDLNRATVDELMLIPGIGEITATRIVEFRRTAGPFRRLADLKKVAGIKEKKFKQWERHFFVVS